MSVNLLMNNLQRGDKLLGLVKLQPQILGTKCLSSSSTISSKNLQTQQHARLYTNGRTNPRMALESREKLVLDAKRIVVKVGSAIITHDQGNLSAPRLASIVEQIAQLQEQGRQMLLVSSGSVAFGRKKIRDEVQKSKSIRETISEKGFGSKPVAQSRAAAAIGQSSLMSFYESLFQQYDCKVAQVLVTKSDFHNESNRKQLRNTLLDLLRLEIVPILNTNDAVEATVTGNMANGVLDLKQADMDQIIVEDNDSLAAILAVEIESDLMIMLSNVDGVYTGPPEERSSKFAYTFTPEMFSTIEFGTKSNVGLGGMQAKVRSALWALRRGTSVAICNGSETDVISRIVHGEKVGTFFASQTEDCQSSELARLARNGSVKLKSIGDDARSKMIKEFADALKANRSLILEKNARDLDKARTCRLEEALVSRLKLTNEKLDSVEEGIRQIAAKSRNQVGRIVKSLKVSESLQLKQVTSPIGVLLVIFESRPDCLPQISTLSLATANGLLLKGGSEAYHSNQCLYNLLKQVLTKYGCQDAVQLVDTRELVNELVSLDGQIDLIIPRGSNELVRAIQSQAKTVPVLGHAEGICHVYIDQSADRDEAIRVALDSKCNYPAACNAMETLLVHRSLVHTEFFSKLCNELKANQVKINIGSRLARELPFYNSSTSNYRVEYGSLECTIELVDSCQDAVDHINEYGSGHTDAIITGDNQSAEIFKQQVDSASVFVNCSTRFADGYRYGLGAEVGISTSKIHARGPAGMESLLTYRWIAEGAGDVVSDYEDTSLATRKTYLHEEIPIQ